MAINILKFIFQLIRLKKTNSRGRRLKVTAEELFLKKQTRTRMNRKYIKVGGILKEMSPTG